MILIFIASLVDMYVYSKADVNIVLRIHCIRKVADKFYKTKKGVFKETFGHIDFYF